jgi:hypothetical protein
MADIADGKVLIQLRVSPEQRDEMRDAGKLAGRSLPNEVVHRLAHYRSEEPGDEARALGDLVALLSRRAERAFDQIEGEAWAAEANDATENRRTRIASTVREALGLVLYELGVTGDAADNTVVQGITWDIVRRMRSPKPKEEDAEGRTLARIGKVLKFKKGKD